MYTHIIKKMFFSKRLYVTIGILLVISFYFSYSLGKESTWIAVQKKLNLQNDYYWLPYFAYFQFFSDKFIIYFMVPLYLIFLSIQSSMFNQDNVILRFHSIERWWKQRTKGIIFSSFFYSLTTFFLMFIIIVISKVIQFVTIDFILFCFFAIFSHALGYIFFGLCYHIIQLSVTKSWLSFLIVVAFNSLVDLGLKGLHSNFNTYIHYFFLSYKSLYATIGYKDLIIVFVVIGVLFILNYLGIRILNKKKFYGVNR